MNTKKPLALPPYYRSFVLPWTRVPDERKRLHKILLTVIGLTAFFGLIVPFLPTTPVEQNQAPEIPPRLAKLIIERKTPPPPPPEVIKPPEEVAVEEPKPEPKEEPEPVEPEPEPEPKPEPKLALVPDPIEPPPVNEAREKAKKSGLVALADDLADLRDTSSIDSALNNKALSNTVGAAQRTERSLLTSSTGRATGGINTAQLSRNVGGQALAGRAVTKVSSPVAAAAANTARAAQAGSSNPQTGGQRSRDQIEMIFDRNKAAIYALYRRALRSDPSLQGKLVLELTISSSGQVTACRVLSSELNAPEFEDRLVKRVRLFDFGSQDVDSVTTTKPIDFFPV